MKAFSIKLDTKSERALARLARIEDRPKGYIIRQLIIEAEKNGKQPRTEKPEARLGGDGAGVFERMVPVVEVNDGRQAA